jgi:hypothetical protein
MKYTIPLLLDNNGEATGLFSIFTSEAPVVIIFTNPLKMERFKKIAFTKLASKGLKGGWASKEASSLGNLIRELMDDDPSLAEDNVNFVSDNDPFCDQLLDSMEKLKI